MKGIILAGGAGTRLYPLTRICCKQLLPIFDKPMIYYPLATLMLGRITEIAIISTPKDLPIIEEVLGDGSRFGVSFTYIVQEKPAGIAQAFILAKDFIGDDFVTLILGDNIFYGNIGHARVIKEHTQGATIFGYEVSNPEEFGVIEFDKTGKVLSIEEKPKQPKSNYAVPGLYVYDNQVVSFAENLKPSPRGELEITDLQNEYLKRGQLNVQLFGRGVAWLDTGTTSSMSEASLFMDIIEKRQGVKVSCPEEIAVRLGLINLNKFEEVVNSLPNCQYRSYLEQVLKELKEK